MLDTFIHIVTSQRRNVLRLKIQAEKLFNAAAVAMNIEHIQSRFNLANEHFLWRSQRGGVALIPANSSELTQGFRRI